MYAAVLHLHVACVALSALGFFARGVLMLRDSPLLATRAARTLPHLNDSVLLAAAIALMGMSGQYPWVADWVAAKIVGLLAYIGLGALALKRAPTRRARLACWLAALLVFAWIVSVALTKNPVGFLAA